MRRLLFVLYGLVAYLSFLASWASFIAFLADLGFPWSVDRGRSVGPAAAVAWDVGLLVVFFAHHSLMARSG
ncbi:MAG TPA: isoprenylcysteine carboxylmethyltransferase family protein, partial [Polyangia bacterium]